MRCPKSGKAYFLLGYGVCEVLKGPSDDHPYVWLFCEAINEHYTLDVETFWEAADGERESPFSTLEDTTEWVSLSEMFEDEQ